MELDALKGPWRTQDAANGAWRKGEGVENLRTRLASLRKASARRDLRETIAAVFVAIIFGWTAFVVEPPLARLGAVIIAAGGVFIIIWMRVRGGSFDSRGAATLAQGDRDMDFPVLEFLQRELRYLERQLTLLRTTGWWYVAPNLIGVELFFFGSGRGDIWTFVCMTGALVLAVVIYWLNQVAAREVLLPLRDEVAGVLRELAS